MALQIVADVRVEVRDPKWAGAKPVSGHVRADGSVVVVEFSRTPSLLGLQPRGLASAVAELLHREGLTLQVHGPSGLVVAAGRDVQAPWWQRPLTGTRLARLGAARAVAGSLAGPRVLPAALPGASPRPALAPAVRRIPRSLWSGLRRLLRGGLRRVAAINRTRRTRREVS